MARKLSKTITALITYFLCLDRGRLNIDCHVKSDRSKPKGWPFFVFCSKYINRYMSDILCGYQRKIGIKLLHHIGIQWHVLYILSVKLYAGQLHVANFIYLLFDSFDEEIQIKTWKTKKNNSPFLLCNNHS